MPKSENTVIQFPEQQTRADFAPKAAVIRSPEEVRETLERLERLGPPDGGTPTLEDPWPVNDDTIAAYRAAQAADDGQPITDAEFVRAETMSEEGFDAFVCKVVMRLKPPLTPAEMSWMTMKLAETRARRVDLDQVKAIRRDDSKKVEVVMGSQIDPRQIGWLWPGWLAHGKLHILAGRPGTLKTTAALGFAAAVTSGGVWPDRSAASVGNVLMWSGEDAAEDILLPRLIAAGGDPANMAFIKGVEEDGTKRSFDPSRDIEGLAATCAALGGVNLIVIDPVASIARGDSHKNAETRRDLQPLADLAERTQAVVLGIHHLTKRSEGADPVDRVSGSLAFGAAPRVVLLSALDPKYAEPHGVITRAKSNIGPSRGGYAFVGKHHQLDSHPDIWAERVEWNEYVNETARDILARFEAKAPTQRKAATFLRQALKPGPRMAAEVIAEGEAAGLNDKALRRALKALGGTSERVGFGGDGAWVWELPKEDA
jgi:RecA-family ATPase